MKTTRRTRREARRLYQGCRTEGRLDEHRAGDAARTVARSTRRGRLAVLSHFHRLVSLDQARRHAVVESAVPLLAELRSRVTSVLDRAYGPGLSTSFEENP